MACDCGFLSSYQGSGGATAGGTAPVNVIPRSYTGSGGATVGGTAPVSSTLIWDGYTGVFHLVEQGVSGEYNYKNSALSGVPGAAAGELWNDFNANGVPQQIQSTLWDECQNMNGANWIAAGSSLWCDTIPATSPLTVSFWMMPLGEFLPFRTAFTRGVTDGSGNGVSLALGYTVSQTIFVELQTVNNGTWNTYQFQGTTELTLGCWYQVACVWEPGTGVTVYLDGNVEISQAITDTQLVPCVQGFSNVQFGRQDQANYFEGELQEVRWIGAALSQEYIQTDQAVLCQNPCSGGGEQSPEVTFIP
jgi:hypothetical protein